MFTTEQSVEHLAFSEINQVILDQIKPRLEITTHEFPAYSKEKADFIEKKLELTGPKKKTFDGLLSFLKSPIISDNIQELLPEEEQSKSHNYRRAFRLTGVISEIDGSYAKNKLKGNFLHSGPAGIQAILWSYKSSHEEEISKEIADIIEKAKANISDSEKRELVQNIDMQLRQILDQIYNELSYSNAS